MNNFIELNLTDSRTSLTEVDHEQHSSHYPYINHLQTMKTKATGAIKKFKFRIAPHPALKEEYPNTYYKFRNKRVATAFFMESLGHEVKI